MRRARVGGLVAIALAAAGLVVSQAAQATAFTGTFGPTIYNGLADVNGSGSVTGADDSNAFFGDTDIIDGGLDCNTWATTNDQDAPGDGVINGSDDCTLLAFDGTSDGATIEVENGSFASIDSAPIPSGTPLPHIFPDPSDPDNGDIGDSFFAWSAIDGRVDSNGNEVIDSEDCSNDLVGPANILSSNQADAVDSCGFSVAGTAQVNGLVDLSDDFTITGTDSCTNACFFGHDVANGFVQLESSGATPTPTPTASPTASPSPVPSGPTLVIGDGGTKVTPKQDCHFIVTLSPGSTGTVRVNFIASSTNTRQISAASGTLVFAPGESTKTVAVDVLNRRRKSATVEVTLSNPIGATITDGVGRCTIKAKKRKR